MDAARYVPNIDSGDTPEDILILRKGGWQQIASGAKPGSYDGMGQMP